MEFWVAGYLFFVGVICFENTNGKECPSKWWVLFFLITAIAIWPLYLGILSDQYFEKI